MTGTGRRLILAAAIALAAPTAAAAAGEGPVTLPVPGSYLQIEAAISPKALGRNTPTPAELQLTGKAVGFGASHPLGIGALKLEVDRNVSLNTDELPSCNPRSQSRGVCRDALIAKGGATILVAAEPPEAPTPIHADLTLYNGDGRGGAGLIYLELRLPSPRRQVLYRAVRLRTIHDGPFGTQMRIAIPRLLGGAGALVSFSMRIPSEATLDAEAVPILMARCPDRKMVIRAEAEIAPGEELVSESIRACTPLP